jgi:hypothetical protein
MATKHTQGQTRYEHDNRSGANEPKQGEKKQARPDWIQPQGGDQARADTKPDVADEPQGLNTRGAQETATLPHLEGAEQGPP